MEHHYAMLLLHLCFGTRDSQPLLSDTKTTYRLYRWCEATSRSLGVNVLSIGGMPDHVHILAGFVPTVNVQHWIDKLRDGSARWLCKTFPEMAEFAWQEGSGCFSVSPSMREKVSAYIRKQPLRHRDETWAQEFARLLRAHGIDFDPDYYME